MNQVLQLLTERFWCICMLAAMFVSGVAAEAVAGLPAGSSCAKVTIEIVQELTLERVAFDARLVLTNNLVAKDLTDVRVDVEIEDGQGARVDGLFFVQPPVTSGIANLSGTGVVKAGSRAEAHWLIIPAQGAGGISPTGIYYFVGATLSYTVAGVNEVIKIFPDRINVMPMPALYLDYFSPYQVNGDNPFTPAVEPPVPFPLAVRVLNDGYGPANKLKIDSARPNILENNQGLLVDFQLLGASVNDQPVATSLIADFGNLASKTAATAYWEMISTMSGRFSGFDVSFTHDSALGGELTSLIMATKAHYLSHMVKVNLPGRDDRLDFLAVTDVSVVQGEFQEDPMALPVPDAIYESEFPNGSQGFAETQSGVTRVEVVSQPAAPTAFAPAVDINLKLDGNPSGWVYVRFTDPSQGLLHLKEVIRGDGVHLDPHNFWVDEKLNSDYQTAHLLQFIDYRGVSGGSSGKYTLIYASPETDITAPTTTLLFDGPFISGPQNYITPQTRVILSATDNQGGSGVAAMLKKVVGVNDNFIDAYPFNLGSGAYSLQYYSIDRSGNNEAVNTAAVTVDDAPPVISNFAAAPTSFSPQAPAGVNASRSVEFTVQANDLVPELKVTVEIIGPTDTVVRRLQGVMTNNTLILDWDGTDGDGHFLPAASYTIRVMVSDGLDNQTDPEAPSHTSTLTMAQKVKVLDWFAGAAVSAGAGDQLYPAASGTRIVWQDRRNGIWQIYLQDTNSMISALPVAAGLADQERPAIAGNIVVWQEQDKTTGHWDIRMYDLVSKTAAVVVNDYSSDQQMPVVSGNWVAWQDNRNGNWDIYVKNLTTNQVTRITSHERDQMNPALDGDLLVWEDYRHGLGEIYKYDLATGMETRMTIDVANQTRPVISSNSLAWTDQRDGHKEIYRLDGGVATRLTYGAVGERSQPVMSGGLLVYTDDTAGVNDPNLSFIDLVGSGGGVLSTNPARQEEAAIGDGLVVWQDDREGRWQIYKADLEVTPLPIDVKINKGLNLVAAGQALVRDHVTAGNLIATAGEGLSFDKVLEYDRATGQYQESIGAGVDFDLSVGTALHIYSRSTGTLRIADGGETATYELASGMNQIGLLKVPYGYKASDLLHSLGMTKVVSVRRYDTKSGLWQSAAIRQTIGGPELVGRNFDIKPGDGLIINMKEAVAGWSP